MFLFINYEDLGKSTIPSTVNAIFLLYLQDWQITALERIHLPEFMIGPVTYRPSRITFTKLSLEEKCHPITAAISLQKTGAVIVQTDGQTRQI